jgi:plasmid stabilization system protein ParE
LIYRGLWSDSVKKKLDRVYWYYEIAASPIVAKRVVQKVLLSSKKLSDFPYKGQLEELLKNSIEEYRYLVSGNYKLIYSINDTELTVKVVDLFDCRQNHVSLISYNQRYFMHTIIEKFCKKAE